MLYHKLFYTLNIFPDDNMFRVYFNSIEQDAKRLTRTRGDVDFDYEVQLRDEIEKPNYVVRDNGIVVFTRSKDNPTPEEGLVFASDCLILFMLGENRFKMLEYAYKPENKKRFTEAVNKNLPSNVKFLTKNTKRMPDCNETHILLLFDKLTLPLSRLGLGRIAPIGLCVTSCDNDETLGVFDYEKLREYMNELIISIDFSLKLIRRVSLFS